jgi:putative transposase
MQYEHSGWRNRTRRLPLAAYAQPGSVCSLTIGVRDRRPVFADHDLAATAVEVLRTHSAKQEVLVYGYCVMPDHVHLVLGPSPRCDVVTFVGQFKNLVLRIAWTRGTQGSFWQSSFWDHFVRSDEGLRAVVEYVLANPVRRGLATDWRDYPFAGSLVFEDEP